MYLRIRDSGRSWFFIGTVNGMRFEMGLGSALDITLARAREKAAEARLHALEGRDPRIERDKAKKKHASQLTFGAFAKQYVDEIVDGFKNPKHRQQWGNTLKAYGEPMADVPIDEIETDDVLRCVQPIWLEKPETASRVRGRIEKVLDAAKAKGLRAGENPARMRGHLELFLPKRSKAKVKHHAALSPQIFRRCLPNTKTTLVVSSTKSTRRFSKSIIRLEELREDFDFQTPASGSRRRLCESSWQNS